ncbi:MAG: hypothetical protein K0S74_844 [Chlamydiales bacterium]|jgi:hypothetical protein|nr:hypothetical protein [Chlamydiales bacterium]
MKVNSTQQLISSISQQIEQKQPKKVTYELDANKSVSVEIVNLQGLEAAELRFRNIDQNTIARTSSYLSKSGYS